MKNYKDVEPNPNFALIEVGILDRWKTQNTFNKSIKGNKKYVFYDGPPFANGLPHYGHLLTGFIKDAFARFHTIIGEHVDRRFGWDCHGLPAEMGAEKDLGISGRIAIEEYGIEQFNNHCRSSVLKYTQEWQAYVTRQGRWVDFDNDYKTMDISYMESVIWAFKELYDKGLLYQSMRVMPYSWACETPVSDFETKMDNSYREKVSKALTVTFNILDHELVENITNLKLVVWTTTPWTLPSNLAIAVGSDIKYVCIEKEGMGYIIAKNLASKYEKELGSNVVANMTGAELVGLKYQPLFDYFKNHKNAFQILAAEFVTTEDGTGIVHIAPGFGEDDQLLCNANNIEVVCPIDNGGKFVYPVEDYKGMQVFETNDPIIIALKGKGSWIKTEQHIHNYPHCWRTDTPLIYKAVPSWYLAVAKIKDRLIKNNQNINWIPTHVKDGLFGKWLAGARDWSISRNRFWGCPIPVWQSDDPAYPNIEVYGSISDIEQAFGVKVNDLHRPFIDELIKPNSKDPTGKSMMRRVEDVLDCWFESGSMPFAQVHYPFENKESFEQNFPADFVVEYLAQTRGWFYTMNVLSTALFDREAFSNCICHGVILGDSGQKLSKRLKNYVDPNEAFNTFGADAIRWYMMSSTVMRGYEVIIDKEGKGFRESLRLAIKPFWNAYNFFVLYANADLIMAKFDLTSENSMDKYIISRCFDMLIKVKSAMNNYDSVNATQEFENFFEILNNWYIRRSRERFWKSVHDMDKINAYNTLYSIILLVCRSISPLLPIISEEIFTKLTNNESVHLENYPDISLYDVDYKLISDMERVRDACNAALFIRNETQIRVRQPLSEVTFIGVTDFTSQFSQLILDEINVKNWKSVDKDKLADYATFKLQIKFPILSKRLAHKMKDIINASKNDEWKMVNSTVEIANEILQADEFELKLIAKEQYSSSITALSTNDALVLLDLNITDELKLEGIARDIVRFIQQSRKTAQLEITEKIKISLLTDNSMLTQAINAWQNYIMEQTLCVAIRDNIQAAVFEDSIEIEGSVLHLKIVKYT